MQSTKDITYLQECLDALSRIYSDLVPHIIQLEELISSQAFIPDDLEASVTTQLSALIASQKDLLERYSLLGFIDSIPSTIRDMQSELDTTLKFLTEKKAFFEIIQFVKGLHSEMPDIEAALDKERALVADFDYENTSAEQCRASLGKYFLLKQTFEEPDSQAKFKLILENLNSLFDFQIVYGLNINAITYTEPEPDVSSDSTPTEDVSSTESEMIFETSPISTDDGSIEISTESDSVSVSASDIQTNSFAKPDLKVKTPDLQTDDSLQPDHTTDSSGDEEITWATLGISDPESLCLEVNNSDMKIRVASRQKKFGVSTFKKDMLRSLTTERVLLMKWAFNHNGISLCSLSRLFKDENLNLADAADKLVQTGYFKEYKLNKKGLFDTYDPYYVLTPNGVKAFTSKESAAFLKCRPAKNDAQREPIPDRANSLLTRIIACQADDLMLEVCPSGNFRTGDILGTDYFIKIFHINPVEKNYVFAGIYSSNIDEFSCIKDTLEGLDLPVGALVIIGMSIDHAKALAAWIGDALADRQPSDAIYYYDMKTEQYYRSSDGSALILSEDNFPDTDSTSEDEATSNDTTPEDSDSEEAFDSEMSPEDEDTKTASGGMDSSVEEATVAEDEAESPTDAAAAKGLAGTDSVHLATSDSHTPVISEASDEAVKSAHPSETVAALQTPDLEDYTKEYQKMLASEEFYCATAYLNALSLKYGNFSHVSQQLSYALNDPLANCTFTSDRLFSVYFSENAQVSEYYTVSAVLRNYFLDQCSYDYSLQMLQGAISSFSLLQENVSLNQVLYSLQQFKGQNHRGIDFYADYRQKKRAAFSDTLSSIRSEALELYNNYCHGRESGFTMRFINTKKLLYSDGTDIEAYLEAVANDSRDFVPLISEFLMERYIKNGMDILPDNIDDDKVYAEIDDAWNRANTDNKHNKSSHLVGSPRTSLFKLLRRMINVLCSYASTVGTSTINEDDTGLVSYKKIRKSLLQDIENAIVINNSSSFTDLEHLAGQKVLDFTLRTLLARIEGSYDENELNYFYIGFLQNDKVLLDDDYLPVLDEVSEIEELSILSRIQAHASESTGSLEQHLKVILNGEDDYGSARLIQNYLKATAFPVDDKELLEISIEKAIIYPKKDMERRREEFIEDLELAQSYGQIDNTTEDRKESLIQIMDSWYEWAIETSNYGFFYKILDAIRAKIKADAQIRAVDLENNLTLYKTAHADWAADEQKAAAISQISARIETQNYAAAEDLLNRLIADDMDTNTDFIQNDYLAEFLREYTLNSSKAGKASSTLQASLSRSHNKDSRAASRLIDNWPKGNGTSASKIADLLRSLGFSVEDVTSQPAIQGKDHFQVMLKRPANGRKSNYKHPISAFGSEAEEKGFRVINIFGKMDAGRLIDTFKEIGSAKNTLVLLDYSLTLPDRRELARRTKTELNGKTFVVVDRVVLVYLASHYSETAVNRMLMAVTMPFASYQPYVAESSKVMPPEIFMGRKNELNKIESASGVNIVYGGRQLGKSAFLRMAQKDINNDEDGDRAVLIDIKGLDYKATARKISSTLFDEHVLKIEHITDDWDELARDIKNRLRDNNAGSAIPYLLLLLDEADVFIESCEAVDYKPFDALKDIQSIGSDRFKFVVAGLRNIVRFKKNIALSNNSVLTQLSSLTVTPFKSTEARELLEVPLSYLGFRFPDDSKTEMLISTIFGTTNYFPGLLQLYCSKLIEALQRDYAGYDESETPPYLVKEAHIKKVLSDKTLEQQIREKYFITLKVDEDDYYYLIALLAAFNYHNNKGQNGCNADDIIEIADSYGISKIAVLSRDKVTALMEEMRELNVLQQIGNGKYRFARHSFCQMMGNMSQIDDEIMKYADAMEAE